MIWSMKKNLTMIGAALATFFLALVRAFILGKKVGQQKQPENTLKSAITRLEVENEINKKSDTDVRTELSDWVCDK
ncbi:hypothetical protein MF1_11130 [Bartonella quintana]|uniref:hypothetical protein n=1 Tax=Bartonella quintana TaxID=803 RepID=UPI001319730B|nr:hypothetical protein [Bartonella quintana]BBL53855.1 hypothetical protein MF1_11130 [Bartonella quintana]